MLQAGAWGLGAGAGQWPAARRSSRSRRFVAKDAIYWHAERGGDAECYLQGWGVLVLLDGDDCLSCNSNALGQFRLGHLSMLEAETPNIVIDRH